MLYNKSTKRPQVMVDCQTCEFFDKKKKRCNGIGKNCFEFDPKTRTADANAGNIDYASFAEKLNIKQSTETTSDGSTVIRFGNLMFIYKAFLIAGNTEQVYTFPYPFDNGSPMCWCNNTASGASADNSCAVTESSSLSMKVRVCGVESSVTLFAIG